ncbi:hypothetical protein B0H63DRAFT_184742 [Podospora didyma]|uniref:Uncharacterized protein n=1 Tax=Podospora didyma TaxID=330526 RepID=A0AAE0TZT0_9PEZI|nr:hypothetical protein B0H63DRAFT_184742 [Podospora didyma]
MSASHSKSSRSSPKFSRRSPPLVTVSPATSTGASTSTRQSPYDPSPNMWGVPRSALSLPTNTTTSTAQIATSPPETKISKTAEKQEMARQRVNTFRADKEYYTCYVEDISDKQRDGDSPALRRQSMRDRIADVMDPFNNGTDDTSWYSSINRIYYPIMLPELEQWRPDNCGSYP